MRRGIRERDTAFSAVAAVLAVAIGFAPARAQVSPGTLGRAHRELEGNANCLECHATRNEGMDAKCLACHREIASLRQAGRGFHARTGDTPCAGCHPDHAGLEFELIDWPGGTVDAFDHAKTGWRLSGRHATAKCRDCHQAKHRKGEAARLARVKDPARSWVGLDPSCASCHTDPHAGRLGPDCGKCHGNDDWKKTAGLFDHGATRYPLTGKHAEVACAKCHRKDPAAAPVYTPIPHGECSSCHSDPHAGRLGPSCASCHATSSFRDIEKSAFDHDRTRYPLRGAHRAVACAACHDPKSPAGRKPQFGACADCHRDPHAGRATLRGAKADCAACHTVERFRPGTLPVAQHAPGRFPLEGRHAEVPCAKCHLRDATAAGRARLGPATVDIRPPSERCSTCHVDPHGGQLASRPDGGACESCHAVAGWKPSTFTAEQHRSLAVRLDGGHGKASCSACHGPDRPGLEPLPAGRPMGAAKVALRGIERDCAGCHRDPHRFEPIAACTDCHDAVSFARARYGAVEHAKTSFPLEGAHRAVPCAACHAELKNARGASSLLRGTGPERRLPFGIAKRACADCHADPHGAQFTAGRGTTKPCEACHGAETFRPASRFDHERDASFRLGKAHAGVPCARCHLSKPMGDGRPGVVYRETPSRCEVCHAPARGGAKTVGDPVSR